MKRMVKIVIFVAGLILLGTVVIISSRDTSIKEEVPSLLPDSSGLERQVPVVGIVVEPRRFQETIVANGILEAWNRVMISSETGGRVIAFHAELGEGKERGEVLLQFDTTVVALQLRQAEAGWQAAKNSYDKQIRDMEKFRRLHEQGNLSDNELEQAELALAGAEATLAGAEASVGMAKRALEETGVRMPFRGRMSKRSVKLGQSVPPGSPVAEVVQTNPVRLTVSLTESDIVRVETGRSVSIKTSGWGDREFTGKVHAVAAAADAATKLFPVEIRLPNSELELRPGMAATARIVVADHDGALVVPAGSVSFDEDNPSCVIARSGRAERLKVTLAVMQSEYAMVESGLSPGDTIIVIGQYGIKQGQRIQVDVADN